MPVSAVYLPSMLIPDPGNVSWESTTRHRTRPICLHGPAYWTVAAGRLAAGSAEAMQVSGGDLEATESQGGCPAS